LHRSFAFYLLDVQSVKTRAIRVSDSTKGLDGGIFCGNVSQGRVDLIVIISNQRTNLQKMMKKILTLCAVALFASSVYAGHYPDITINDLKAAAASKSVTILDVNGTDSYKDGHIPGAIDFAANKEKLATVLPKDKSALVVAYCGGPQCKAYEAAAKAAQKLGYTNVKHLSAGISGWQDSGQKMEKAN
jgi:rhodanese-related sulfurtransferase